MMSFKTIKEESYRKDKKTWTCKDTWETWERRTERESIWDGMYKKEVVWTIWNKDWYRKEELKRERTVNYNWLDWDDDIYVISSYINWGEERWTKFWWIKK